MKELITILKECSPPLFPKIKRDDSKKEITFIEEGWIGNNLTSVYWAFKGYSIKGREEDEDNQEYDRKPEQEYRSGEGI